jgi:hypothetical protein
MHHFIIIIIIFLRAHTFNFKLSGELAAYLMIWVNI